MQACADKLDRELTDYGIPPRFPEVEAAAEEVSSLVPHDVLANMPKSDALPPGQQRQSSTKDTSPSLRV